MNRFFKIAALLFVVYIGFMYYAGSNTLLDPSYTLKALPTWSFTPRGTIAPIGTPSVPDLHGVLEAAWPTDSFGNQFYPLGYTNNTSYPLLQNNYPI